MQITSVVAASTYFLSAACLQHHTACVTVALRGTEDSSIDGLGQNNARHWLVTFCCQALSGVLQNQKILSSVQAAQSLPPAHSPPDCVTTRNVRQYGAIVRTP